MNSVLGLPAHPLFVHAPVVLMPLALVLAIVLASRAVWRHKAGWALVVASGATFVATLNAKLSGESLDESMNDSGNFGVVDRSVHEGLANTTTVFVLLFFLFSILIFGFDWWKRRLEVPPTWAGSATAVMMALVLVAGVLASVWMIRTGHEGATLVHEGKV